MKSENDAWYAIHTRSRHEQMVYNRLIDKALEMFLPLTEVWSKRRDRKKRIKLPLFPGYLFVHCEMDARNFLKIVETPGVVRILGYGNEPTPVPDTEIFSLQAILRENVALDPHPYLQVGERVRIKAGPLKDVVGILLRKHPDKDRLVISVDMLNKAVSIELDSWDIEVY